MTQFGTEAQPVRSLSRIDHCSHFFPICVYLCAVGVHGYMEAGGPMAVQQGARGWLPAVGHWSDPTPEMNPLGLVRNKLVVTGSVRLEGFVLGNLLLAPCT